MDWYDPFDPELAEVITSEHLKKNQTLLEALSADDVDTLEGFLDRGVSPDSYLYYNGGKRPMITIAVQRKSIDVVRLLCTRGCSLTTEDKLDDSKQPLHVAIDRSYRDIALMLIKEFSADPSACNRTGRNAFHYAALQKEPEILTACIRTRSLRGVDLVDSWSSTLTNHCGYTPLMYIFCGPVPRGDAMVEELIGTGLINFSRLSRRGETVLEVACSGLFLQLPPMRSLLKHLSVRLGPQGMKAELRRTTVEGETILTLTLKSNPSTHQLGMSRTDGKGAKLIKWLIRHGADIDQPNYLGETPIFIAVQKRFRKTIAALIDLGCDLNVKNGEGLCPLAKACRNEDPEIVAMLLESGGYHRKEPCCQLRILGESSMAIMDEVKQQVKDYTGGSQPPSLLLLSRDAIRKSLRGSWTRGLAPHLPRSLCQESFPTLVRHL